MFFGIKNILCSLFARRNVSNKFAKHSKNIKSTVNTKHTNTKHEESYDKNVCSSRFHIEIRIIIMLLLSTTVLYTAISRVYRLQTDPDMQIVTIIRTTLLSLHNMYVE